MKSEVRRSIFLILLMICMVFPIIKCQRIYAATIEMMKVAGSTETPDTADRSTLTLERPVVSCVDRTASKVYLEWAKIKKAEKYYIYRASKKNGAYKKIGKTTKLTYTDKTVKAGKTYYYKIYASGSTGQGVRILSKYSKQVKVTVKSKVKKTAYVGDSVMSGLSSCNIAMGKGSKVISKIGVSSYNFYNGSIMDTLLDYNPDRMFIMLGMNSLVGKPSESTMNWIITYYKKIIKECLGENPDMQIIVLPVSPTRPSARVGNSYINKFNAKAKKMAKECKVYYYDYTSFLKGSDGALKKQYNSGDGIHWKASAYQSFKDKLDAFGKTLN